MRFAASERTEVEAAEAGNSDSTMDASVVEEVDDIHPDQSLEDTLQVELAVSAEVRYTFCAPREFWKRLTG